MLYFILVELHSGKKRPGLPICEYFLCYTLVMEECCVVQTFLLIHLIFQTSDQYNHYKLGASYKLNLETKHKKEQKKI